MKPQNTRVWRKTRHRAWRGTPRGRRSTHAVETIYGKGQAERDRRAHWDALRAEIEAQAAKDCPVAGCEMSRS